MVKRNGERKITEICTEREMMREVDVVIPVTKRHIYHSIQIQKRYSYSKYVNKSVFVVFTCVKNSFSSNTASDIPLELSG